jgi:hypothetical protein
MDISGGYFSDWLKTPEHIVTHKSVFLIIKLRFEGAFANDLIPFDPPHPSDY